MPFAGDMAHQVEHLAGVLHVEHGGRLVHNQHARAIHQRLENFHKLLIGHRHVFYGLKRIDVDAIALHDLAHALSISLKATNPPNFVISLPTNIFSTAFMVGTRSFSW